jgi:predicted DNA-binding antitoxin AbrB/MazE fold protein
MLPFTEIPMSEIDWKGLEEQIRKLRVGEKVSDDMNDRYTAMVKEMLREKPDVWYEKLRPFIDEVLALHKEDPEEAVEVLVSVIMQIVHHLAQHEVLIEYSVALQTKIVESLGIESQKTSKILEVLYRKGVLAPEDLH